MMLLAWYSSLSPDSDSTIFEENQLSLCIEMYFNILQAFGLLFYLIHDVFICSFVEKEQTTKVSSLVWEYSLGFDDPLLSNKIR